MADRGVDLSALPKEVRDQLAELDLELSEGELSPRSGFISLSFPGNRRQSADPERVYAREARSSDPRLS